MKFVSAGLFWLQVIAFLVLTAAVFWMFGQVFIAGAWFDARFASTQFWRLVAFLAPYLALPISIILTFVLHKKGKYGRAIWLPLAFIALVSVAGQSYLRVVPDPIRENFGARAEPYPGFLVLPQEAVPEGFKEVEHHFTKREYIVRYTKMLNGQKIDLGIAEGDRIMFGHSGSELVKEFEYQGITGQVYINQHSKTGVISYNLIWLHPPKQRIAIHLTQTANNDYSPDDLIAILKSMKPAKEAVPELQ
jgi:hypothetical protein